MRMRCLCLAAFCLFVRADMPLTEMPCRNPFCVISFLGDSGVDAIDSGGGARRLFRAALLHSTSSMNMPDLCEQIRPEISVLECWYVALYAFERSLRHGDEKAFRIAKSDLLKCLAKVESLFDQRIPSGYAIGLELTLARVVCCIPERLQWVDEAFVFDALSDVRLERLSFAGHRDVDRIRGFRNMLVLSMRILAYRIRTGVLPSSISDLPDSTEHAFPDIAYERRGTSWQLRIGDDGDKSAAFDVYVPTVCGPLGFCKTEELRFSGTFHQKRKRLFDLGGLHEGDFRFGCKIDHSRKVVGKSHPIVWSHGTSNVMFRVRLQN